MRKQLKRLNGRRLKFTAKVERFGSRSGYKGTLQTILLKDIKIAGKEDIITDHLWFTKGKSWDCCREGCNIEFEARVSEYFKGYKGHDEYVALDNPVTKDYRLERPTKIKLIS